MQEDGDSQTDSDALQQQRFDDVCDAFAELILEAIATAFEESGGAQLHPETHTEGDLIAVLNRATTDTAKTNK